MKIQNYEKHLNTFKMHRFKVISELGVYLGENNDSFSKLITKDSGSTIRHNFFTI